MKTHILFLTFFSGAIVSFSQVPALWNVTGIGGGGALFAPTINPANNSEFYISSDLSAIYHTTDNGQSYSILDGKQIQGFHNSTVRFTSTPNLLYAVNYADNEIVPVKSTDDGITWSTLAGNPDEFEETFSINVNYNNPNQIVLGYYGTIYFSNDGGNSFTNIHNAISNGAGCLVAGVFFDGDNIYIGSNDGLFVSSNGGSTFTTSSVTGIPSTERIFSFAGAKAGNITRFFCLTGDVNDTYNGEQGSDYWGYIRGVYSLDYGSGNWISKMNGINASTDYLMFVGMAENDINTCYLAGGSSSSNPDVMKTTDGGDTWNHVFNTTNNQNIITGWCGSGGDKQWSWAECPFGLAVASNNSDVVLLGDYSMVTRTDDGGATWKQAYVSAADENPANASTPTKQTYHSVGMENTACWQVFWNDQNNLFGAYTDIFMIRSQDAGQSWSFNYAYTPSNTVYRITKSASGNLYAAENTLRGVTKYAKR